MIVAKLPPRTFVVDTQPYTYRRRIELPTTAQQSIFALLTNHKVQRSGVVFSCKLPETIVANTLKNGLVTSCQETRR